jgi:hypothetical protein
MDMPPAWVSLFAALIAAVSFFGIYVGTVHPEISFWLLGFVGAANAFLAAMGYASGSASTGSAS